MIASNLAVNKLAAAFSGNSGLRHGVRGSCQESGLFRSVVGGAGSTLTQAFGRLPDPHWRQQLLKDETFGLYGATIPIPNESPGNVWELLSIRDQIFAVITKCDYHRVRHETVPGESFVELHFSIDGETTFSGTANDEIAVGKSTLLVCRQAVGTNYTVYCPPGARSLVSLYVRPTFLLQHLGMQPDAASDLLADPFGGLVVRQFPLRFEAQEAIRLLLETSLVGAQRLHFYAAKVIELLCQCTHSLRALRANDNRAAFSERDLRMFDLARQLLATQFNPQPTIFSVARAVGTNTNKLKTGFRLIYGTTLFDFGNRHRMQHAMKLLVARQHSVAEVAAAVGYRSQASFSTAFKDFFNQLPRDVRRTSQRPAGSDE